MVSTRICPLSKEECIKNSCGFYSNSYGMCGIEAIGHIGDV